MGIIGRYKLSKLLDGDPYDDVVPPDQIDKMSKIWGEGSENLTQLIKYCLENGVRTRASCKGHGNVATSYLSFGSNPKEFFMFMLDYMMKNNISNSRTISRFGNRRPSLNIYSASSLAEKREGMFRDLLTGVREYVRDRDKLDITKFDKRIVDSVSEMYTSKGWGTEREFFFTDPIDTHDKDMPKYMVSQKGKVGYGYNPIASFCLSSKKILSRIKEVPRRIKAELAKRKTNEHIKDLPPGVSELGEQGSDDNNER